MQSAVQQFQISRGLNPDGVVGPGTMTEINRPIESHMQAVMVAMERERWMNRPRGKRHIWVNLTDFSAVIMDNNKETFRIHGDQPVLVCAALDHHQRIPATDAA